MEQGSEGGDMNKQPQKEMQQGDTQVQAPQQPQKCPRCDSLNTKFCYYNNYSLSQPRYFCKTCRRYWTQGGTLRNVPVGGGCRKGKRAKSSNSSSPAENSSSRSLPPPPPQQLQPQEVGVQTQPLTTVVRPKDPSIGPFYQSGGYLSSLAAMHSLNPSSHPFDQSLNIAATGDALRSSNLGLLSGFNVSSFGSQQRPVVPIRPPHLYQMGDATRSFAIADGQKFQHQTEVVSMYGQGLINPIPPSSIANTNSGVGVGQHDWSQSFINDNAGNRASDASLWSTISTTIGGGNSERTSDSAGAGAGSSSLVVPNQWPNLPGYGPPP